jgi:hypothetical protein
MEPERAGIKIQLYDHDQDVLYVGIICNSRQFLRKNYTLACMNKGELMFIKESKSGPGYRSYQY